MKRMTILIWLFLMSMTGAIAKGYQPFVISDTEIIPIKDTGNHRQYQLYVKLPKSYVDNTQRNYPVIYFTDAEWHLELLSAATTNIFKEVILVGISWQTDLNHERDHFSRYRDYSMFTLDNAEHQATYQFGQANKHLAFIQNDVIQYVEKHYRTDMNNRSYFGYSMGGSFGAYILMVAPNTFKNYILGSPDLKRLSDHASKGNVEFKAINANVYITNGTSKDEVERGKSIETFITYLQSRKDRNLSLIHEKIEGDHSGAFPLAGVRSVIWLSTLLGSHK